MIRKLKLLGVTAVAMLSMSAVLAIRGPGGNRSADSAAVPGDRHRRTAIRPGVRHRRRPAADRITCGSKLDATLFGPTDPVTFTTDIQQLRLRSGADTGDNHNERLRLHSRVRPNRARQAQPFTTGTMQAWINCPAGQQIEIHVYLDQFQHAANVSTCTYDVGPQGPVPAGIYHNTIGRDPRRGRDNQRQVHSAEHNRRRFRAVRWRSAHPAPAGHAHRQLHTEGLSGLRWGRGRPAAARRRLGARLGSISIERGAGETLAPLVRAAGRRSRRRRGRGRRRVCRGGRRGCRRRRPRRCRWEGRSAGCRGCWRGSGRS